MSSPISARWYRRVLSRVSGPITSPWYTRWFWWVVIVGAFALVLLVWWLAKRHEADIKARARTAQDEAKKARLEVEEAHDVKRLAELSERALKAEKRAEWLAQQVETTARKRKEVEAAIKGASSWEELDKIEEELE